MQEQVDYKLLYAVESQIMKDIQQGSGDRNYLNVGVMASELSREGLIDTEMYNKLLQIDRMPSGSEKLPFLIDSLPSWLMTPVKGLLKKNDINYTI